MRHVPREFPLILVAHLIHNTGEPGFIEKMHLEYHDLATQLHITICHAAVHFYN